MSAKIKHLKKKTMKKERMFLINMLFVILAICFLGCSGGSDDSEEQQQEEEATLEGNYRGSWDSTTSSATFTGVAVSAKLQFGGSSNVLTGSFFISSDFTVCCSAGENDGTLVINFDGDTITAFNYNDVITNCSGTFNGTGVIRASDKALVIDFTGNDCDGDHVGQIVLKK